MAIVKTVLNNGSKSCLIHYYFNSDGSAELKNVVLADTTNADPVLDGLFVRNSKLTITQVWHSFSQFDATLSFDDLNPVPCWILSNSTGHTDFRHFGGLANRYIAPVDKMSTDRTNKVLISTKGYALEGSIGTLIIEVRKDLS